MTVPSDTAPPPHDGPSEPSRYPRPSVTVDRVLLTVTTGPREPHRLPARWLSVLLVERARPPFAGCWALPGGFSGPGETLEAAGARELREETGLSDIPAHFLGPYSTPERDPRGWVISMAYYSLVARERLTPRAGDDAARTAWWSLPDALALPSGGNRGMAFDHHQILTDALVHVRRDVHTSLVVQEFLPDCFTLSELLQVLCLFDPSLDGRHRGNFTRKIIQRGIVIPAGAAHTRYSRKPSDTYRFTGRLPQLSPWV